MHLQTKIDLFSFLLLFYEQQLMENIRFRYVVVELLNEKLALLTQSLYHRDDKVNVLRIVLTLLVFGVLTFDFYYLHNCIFDEWEVDLLYEVFLITIELGVDRQLTHLDRILIEHQDWEVFIEDLLVFSAFSDEFQEKEKACLEYLLVFFRQIFFKLNVCHQIGVFLK